MKIDKPRDLYVPVYIDGTLMIKEASVNLERVKAVVQALAPWEPLEEIALYRKVRTIKLIKSKE